MLRNMNMQLRIFPKLGLPTTGASFQLDREKHETKVFFLAGKLKKKKKEKPPCSTLLPSATRALALVLACSG